MEHNLFNKIAARLIENGAAEPEDKELYEYGLRHIANMILNTATVLVIGFIFGMIWQSILFMALYIPLRSYAGGYHARTTLRCYVFSVILTTCVLAGIKFIPQSIILIAALVSVFSLVIFIFAPIGDENKPLDELEVKVFKNRARIVLSAEIILTCLFCFLRLFQIASCLMVSITAAGVMVLIGVIRSKIKSGK